MWEYAVIFFILAVVGYLIFHPLLRPRVLAGLTPPSKEIQEKLLEKQKEDVYAAIKEMDFDFGMGKISEQDYQELRDEYKSKAVDILKELDTEDRGDDLDAAIELEVQQLRKQIGIKEEQSARETSEQINFCPKCGGKVDPNDNFCRGCGMKLAFGKGRT
jgi:rRNA maturation endonuclease Nob1